MSLGQPKAISAFECCRTAALGGVARNIPALCIICSAELADAIPLSRMPYRQRSIIRVLVLLMAKQRSKFARLLAAAVSAQKHGHTVRARVLLDLAIREIDRERFAVLVQQRTQPTMKD